MIETLQYQDDELIFNDVKVRDIIESITMEDVKTFLESLGVDQIIMCPEKGYLICPTICHNPINEEASMKLYWYQDNKIFRCYTECNEAMSIFTLYQKFMDVSYGQHVEFYEAEDYVKKCLKHIVYSAPERHSSLEIDTSKYEFNANLPLLDEYPSTVMDCFVKYHHPLWLHEGIKPEVMDKFDIRFSIGQNKIVIPHYDLEGRLIGIRGRTLNPDEIKEFKGKYRPMQVGNIIYSHPLTFNLYGIHEHQEGIRTRRSAIIVEGEKSVLFDDGFYGDLSNTVACCGSSFNKYHVNLLTNYLGVNEITIAFDKEYEDWRSEKAKAYREKIEAACNKYKGFAQFSFIWDYDNLLEEKDSPFDKGQAVFEELYRNRVKVR